MAFPIMALLTAAASDLQSRQAEREALRQAGDAGRQNIMRRRAAELGGSPYYSMGQDTRNALSEIEREARASRNNQIGNLLQAYLKQPSAPEERTLIGGAPTIDDLPGVGSRSGIGMVDSIFAGTPTTMPSVGGLGEVDSLFGNESSKLWEDDPWGSGAF